MIGIEVFADAIRNKNMIKVIKVGEKEIKASLYADDTTVFADDTTVFADDTTVFVRHQDSILELLTLTDTSKPL